MSDDDFQAAMHRRATDRLVKFEEPAESQLIWPEKITPELREVLGLMCFTTGPMAHLFRDNGADIPSKIEEEQAFVMHWLIGLAL